MLGNLPDDRLAASSKSTSESILQCHLGTGDAISTACDVVGAHATSTGAPAVVRNSSLPSSAAKENMIKMSWN